MVVITEGTRDLNAAPDAAARATLRAQADAMATRLEQIQNAASPTNAQVIQALRDLATYQERLLKVLVAVVRNAP